VRRLGRIVGLQVQVAPLKHGERPDRGYDTGRIRRVTSLEVTAHGVVGHGVIGHADDATGSIIDVHHRDHPESRWRGDNGISLLTTGPYALMRERFGPHVVDGIAAESVLVERSGWLDLQDLAGGVTIVPGDATGDATGDDAADAAGLRLGGASPAQPCVEFSRLVSGAASGSLREPLTQLRDGMRGYYLQVEGGTGTVLREGDRVLVRDQA
jgi:hypothetical protein